MDDPDEAETVDTPDDEQIEDDDDEHQDHDAENFPASVVKGLREKNSRYRTRAHEAEQRATDADARIDELSRALFTARVASSGKLADVSDLAYDADLLDDADALDSAIDELVTRKPHLAARKITGAVGQGVKGKTDEPFSILGRLKQSV